MAELSQLYQHWEPLGEPILTHFHPFHIPHTNPTETEVINAIDPLKRGKAKGSSRMSAEHFHEWYRTAYLPIQKEADDDSRDSTESN
jgi:hypothetical protein